jgi:hypothetical protein
VLEHDVGLPAQILVQELLELRGIERLGEGGEPADVREENGDLSSLPA